MDEVFPSNSPSFQIQAQVMALGFWRKKLISVNFNMLASQGHGTCLSGWLLYSSGKEPACQCRRCRKLWFNPCVRKIPWGRKWKPPSVFLPGEFHGQRSLAGYSPRGHKGSDMTEWLNMNTHCILEGNWASDLLITRNYFEWMNESVMSDYGRMCPSQSLVFLQKGRQRKYAYSAQRTATCDSLLSLSLRKDQWIDEPKRYDGMEGWPEMRN